MTEQQPFYYRDGRLFCEGVSIEGIAASVGTPFYLYSYSALVEGFRAFARAFGGLPHLICFSVKANGNLAVLKILASEGAGADVASGGELYRALQAGIDPKKIVFAGVGKTASEITEALKANILMLNVESTGELELINTLARELGRRAGIALRVNPNLDPKTHPYLATALGDSKFGLDIKEALEHYRRATALKNLEILGVHIHLGSQITRVEPFIAGAKALRSLALRLKRAKIEIRYLNLGGGLGVAYQDERLPTPEEFAGAVRPVVEDLGLTVIIEPGRAIAAKAGILVTRVLYVKRGRRNFVVVDAGMNDLIRPSLYGAYHAIWPVRAAHSEQLVTDVVGPVCEVGDFLGRDVKISCKPFDLLAIMDTGAYGFSMASNYNSRPRAAEVLVKGEDFWVVRERESYKDLVRGERIPPLC